MAEGFGDPIEAVNAMADFLYFNRELETLNVLVCFNEEPAGVQNLTRHPFHPEIALAHGAVVLQRFRGQGVYSSLVHESARIARSRGVRLL